MTLWCGYKYSTVRTAIKREGDQNQGGMGAVTVKRGGYLSRFAWLIKWLMHRMERCHRSCTAGGEVLYDAGGSFRSLIGLLIH
jgi:hypothetical protein